MFRRLILMILAVISISPLLAACAKKQSPWDGSYSRVYQRARENDSGYVQPSVVSCVDDDLFNCR